MLARVLSRVWKVATDDDASAAVEFVVLIPVYLLLLVSMLTIGHLVLVRQQVTLAARFRAGEPLVGNTRFADPDVSASFFPIFDRKPTGGTFQTLAASRGMPWTVSEGDLAPQGAEIDRIRGTGQQMSNPDRMEARRVGSAILNDSGAGDGTSLLAWSDCTVGFTYRAAWIPQGWTPSGDYSLRARAETLLPNASGGGREIHRRGHRSGQQEHPITDYRADQSETRGFDPAQINNRYSSPTDMPIVDLGGDPPGVWSTGYRLNGNVFAEWAFYSQNIH
jgi:hypothetical protein